MSKLPKSFLRFYRSTDYALQCIEDMVLTAPKATMLNDPFDPPFYFFSNSINKNLIEKLESIENQLKEHWINETFIASFCGIKNDRDPIKTNLYMWSHYANGHRSAAIEFDTEKLLESLDLIPGMTDEVSNPEYIYKVRYETPPLLTEDEILSVTSGNANNIEKKFNKLFLCKSKNWRIENEWRFILNSGTSQNFAKIKLVPETIKSVYLGLSMDQKIKEAFVKQIYNNFPKAKIYIAKRCRDVFGIYFKKPKIIHK